jgi:hypothetical protein
LYFCTSKASKLEMSSSYTHSLSHTNTYPNKDVRTNRYNICSFFFYVWPHFLFYLSPSTCL